MRIAKYRKYITNLTDNREWLWLEKDLHVLLDVHACLISYIFHVVRWDAVGHRRQRMQHYQWQHGTLPAQSSPRRWRCGWRHPGYMVYAAAGWVCWCLWQPCLWQRDGGVEWEWWWSDVAVWLREFHVRHYESYSSTSAQILRSVYVHCSYIHLTARELSPDICSMGSNVLLDGTWLRVT